MTEAAAASAEADEWDPTQIQEALQSSDPQRMLSYHNLTILKKYAKENLGMTGLSGKKKNDLIDKMIDSNTNRNSSSSSNSSNSSSNSSSNGDNSMNSSNNSALSPPSSAQRGIPGGAPNHVQRQVPGGEAMQASGGGSSSSGGAMAAGAANARGPHQMLAAALTNQAKLIAFRELMTMGLGQQDAMAIVADASDEDLQDVSMLVYNWMCSRSGLAIPQSEEEEARLKEQEDREMDLAILNSESEREVIRDRKRQRVSDISADCGTPLGDAPEFKASILMGLKEQDATLTSKMQAVECTPNPTSHVGSELLSRLVMMLDIHTCKFIEDNNNSSSSSSSSSSASIGHGRACSCGEGWRKLRKLLSRLLLLEVDAVKFAKEMCFAYLLLLGKRLDDELLESFQTAVLQAGRGDHRGGSSSASSSSSSGDHGSDSHTVPPVPPCPPQESKSSSSEGDGDWNGPNPLDDDEAALRPIFTSLCSSINNECNNLEKALYSLPEHGQLVPLAFTSCDPTTQQGNAYCIDDDGFELL